MRVNIKPDEIYNLRSVQSSFTRRAGWEAVGIDPDPKAVAVARSLGLTAAKGFIDKYEKR